MDEFPRTLGDTQRKAIKVSLDNYVESVLAHNNAVVEYNAAVQQLQEARKNQKYCTDQMSSAANIGLI
ncbi:uncharacterized protein ACHE_80068A [Aspergillus chevalieri]|uniref:Uncharacterized protein n=1 Tax=Aspergillus chevalieri TaxID=182096 RepID=A0A7R7VXN1_ASPCH|nr:uncharacterized protein ACHE_80068A [Aspergillus chevalieri]BCR92168.1 hypothetical protein ACHE_80068A [Aspergillus chevalieri]